jgi:hypothetical protein
VSGRGHRVHVDVTLRDAGNGTVEVTIDGAGGLGVDRALLFGIAAAGDDYLVVLRPAGAVLGKWDGAAWAPFPHQALGPRAGSGGYSFSLALADLGARTFDYWLSAVRGDDVEAAPEWGRFTSLRA